MRSTDLKPRLASRACPRMVGCSRAWVNGREGLLECYVCGGGTEDPGTSTRQHLDRHLDRPTGHPGSPRKASRFSKPIQWLGSNPYISVRGLRGRRVKIVVRRERVFPSLKGMARKLRFLPDPPTLVSITCRTVQGRFLFPP